MNLLFAGGDLRFAWATRLAAQQGLNAAAVGLATADFPLPEADERFVRNADAVIMPNPWRAVPSAEAPWPRPEAVMAALKRGAAIVLPDDAGAPPDAPPHLCLQRDEIYVTANAQLTAEGAVSLAMRTLPCAIHGIRALVIGYGRIGSQAARLITALGGSVTVAARREQARRRAEAEGAAACPLEALEGRLARWRLIISTPPAPVLTGDMLSEIDKSALLIDLASPPYGFSLETAQALGLRASRENGLPGRYCPESAGCLLLDAALRAIEKGERGYE